MFKSDGEVYWTRLNLQWQRHSWLILVEDTLTNIAEMWILYSVLFFYEAPWEAPFQKVKKYKQKHKQYIWSRKNKYIKPYLRRKNKRHKTICKA